MPRRPGSITRRGFLAGSSSAALLAALPAVRLPQSPLRLRDDPFTLGVASGYPGPDGMILWTRLAPDPLAGGGMPDSPVEVAWEVASDEAFERVVRRGQTLAYPAFAHSVHVDVHGLEPDRWYLYRFSAAGHRSPSGRTRTAPRPEAVPDRLRFAIASCQHFEQGYYAAFRDMTQSDLDLIVHLGDYIYETSGGGNRVRSHASPEPVSLDDYRIRHALYKSDPDLRAAHAACPWLVTWDDHEVDNDYANDRSEQLAPRESFLARRAAAYRAYYEHMPLPAAALPIGPNMRLFAESGFGALAGFFVLDDRQYRAPQACPPPGRGGSATVRDCPERFEPGRSLLGAAQEQWLLQGLARSPARWNVLAQQTVMAQVDRDPSPERGFWTDAWDGYPESRRRIIDFLDSRNISNPLVLGGDVHVFYVADLKKDFEDPRSRTVASEFVCTGVTSTNGFTQDLADRVRADNPHVRFLNTGPRGYIRLELTAERARSELRAVADATDPGSSVDTLAAFVVENHRPGAQPDRL